MGTEPLRGDGNEHARSLSGERTQVTALFYDIVGSAELLNRLDPEEFGVVQRAVHLEALAAIRDRGGRIERMQGDGGCAYFGIPTSQEDAADAAVAAALEIVERCGKAGRQSVPPVQIRVGVATGLVVVADTNRTTLPGQDEVIGIAPILAARIQAEAEPNGVAVSEATYQLTSNAFEFEPIGIRHVRGFTDPLRLWRPLARIPHRDRFSAYRRAATPLVGREDELDLSRRRWKRAVEGRGQFLFLQGEAGIGKSRLVAELRDELAEGGFDIAVYQCQPRGDTRPLHPFLDRLKQGIAAERADSEPIDAAAVRHYLASQGLEPGEADAEVMAFLCGGSGDIAESGPALGDLSQEEIRSRALEATLGLVAGWSSTRPRLVVLEDVHWADTLTQSVIAELPERIASRPILVAATSREPVPADVAGDHNVLSIGLSRLGAEAVNEMVALLWESPPPPGLAAFVYDKSVGGPLFVQELALLLKARFGGQESTQRDWDEAMRKEGILTLRDAIEARLAGLGDLRRIAQVASVIGRDFRLDLLSHIVDSKSLKAPLDKALQRLVDQGIVRRPAAADASYRFRHVLIHETAYDSLLKSERRTLHERIVDLVESGISTLPDGLVAWHCAQAGQPLKAAQHAVREAESCVVRSAVREADRLLVMAEEQLAACAGQPEAEDSMLQLLTTRGPVAAALLGRGAEETRAIYERGVALCQQRTAGDRAKWFPLYWGWWFTAPDYGTQRDRSQIILRAMEGTSDPEARLQALHCAWATNFDAGAHAFCLQCVEEGLALYDEKRARRGRVRYGGHDAKVCGLGDRALAHWFMGEAAKSDESMAETMRWAEHIDHLDSTLHALEYALGLTWYRRDSAGVIAMADRMIAVASENALPGPIATAKIFRGWARAVGGALAEGHAELEEGFARQREIGTEENVSIYGSMQAEILVQTGRREEALAVLDKAIAHATQSGQVFWLAELHRSRALLRRALGSPLDAVEAELSLALDVAREQQAEALAARIRETQAKLGLPQPGPAA